MNAVEGRSVMEAVGPRVLVVTVPKSGTHLVDSILERMPPLQRQGRVALNAKLRFHPFNFLPFAGTATCMAGIGRPHRVKVSALRHALTRIRPWRYAMSQLPWQPVVMQLLESLVIRPIVAVRDPRDVIVSLMHHALSKPEHFMHAHLSHLPTDHERLVTLIKGATNDKGQESVPLAQRLDFILGWVEDPRVLTVRFEDLVGPKGGGSADRQHGAIMALAQWAGRPVEPGEATRIGEEMFGKGKTFRKGRVAGWREAFDSDVAALFEHEVGDRMRRLGYSPR
jgi:sulfotransferase family protein